MDRINKPDSLLLDVLSIFLLVILTILCAGEPDLLDVFVQHLMLNVCE